VRFLRKSAAEDGNPYGVGEQFAVGGHGTGGYLSLSMATLNDYESELLMPKFIDTSDETIAIYGQPVPYIMQSMWGNFEATNYGWHPAYDLNGDGIFEDVPLCIPNHVGYSSEVDMVFNAGGALPDISWLEAGEVPIASMQNIADPDAPYAEGNVIVPTTGEFVIVAHGSQLVQENATAFGNNDVFAGLSTSVNDAWYANGNAAANAAVAGHADLPGLFAMITPDPSASPTPCGYQAVQNAPWDWWDNATYGAMADGYHGVPSGTMGCLALLGNPDMSSEKGAAMCDMMDEFFTPRVAAALNLVSQPERYVDEIFDEVTVSSNIIYGSNIGIITQAPALEDLIMDVYEPVGDNATDRRVIVMLHTGSFLPAIVNGQATGSKTDNSIVEMCMRFAKKGYVAVAIDYRLGWNPISPSEDVRRSTLIQAAYRGLQDTKTAVRFLRKSAAEDGNPYGVGEQFAVGGHGTGGYLSLSMATLNDYESELLMPKFIDTSDETIAIYGQPVPYIMQSMWGNFEATNYGWHPAYDLNGDGIFEDVPLCIPNHVGYSSEVDMVFNAGGALPDISWLEAGEVPIASMQNIADPDAPYAEGNVIVPTTGEFVIVAHGSQLVQENATAFGNNDVFAGLSTSVNDAWYANGNAAANAAVAGHADLPGLFAMITPDPSASPTPCGYQAVQNAPWDWWDNATYGAMADGYHGVPSGTMGCLALLGNPDMSAEKGAAMCDMMDQFFTPRIDAALSVEVVEDQGPTEQVLNLPLGWSMFSTYMTNDAMAVDVMLAPIVEYVVIAKNYLGSAYLPEWGFNGIGDVLTGQAYQIKTTEALDLTVSGDYMLPEENPIDLVAGWNMIGYLRLDGAPADLVLADLVANDNVVIAKDYLGSAYLPEWGFNGIGNLEPGMGYQIKTNTQGILNFLSNDESYRLASMQTVINNIQHFDLPTNTGRNMHIGIFDEAWEVIPEQGDEIAAYNRRGELIGSAIYSSPVTVLTVWGDDVTTTQKVDGLINGESMTFKLWSDRYNTSQNLIVKDWIEGSNAYQTDVVYQIGAIENANASSAISQMGLYPIPTKSELNIDLTLVKAEKVTVSIYNLIGELIVTNSHNLSDGFNNIKLDIEKLKDGAYICKVRSTDGQMARKFNVIK
jgi:CTP:molybdopterin cytidylyltransferase MocA